MERQTSQNSVAIDPSLQEPGSSASAKPESQENPFLSLAFSILIPTVILTKFSGPDSLGPVTGLLVAIAFPLGWGLRDLIKTRRAGLIPALGLISVLLTGGFGLLKLDGFWFAVKEAAIPLLIGLAVVGSMWTKQPLVRTFLYNDKVLDTDRIDQALAERNRRPQFDRLLREASWLLGFSFLLSAVLNFGLAIWILKSPAGTTAFNEELGRMTALSFPVISIPCMVVMMFALWRLIKGLQNYTGLGMNEIMRAKG